MLKSDNSNQIYYSIVLFQTRHGGNLGSCARAMKNFGFSDLRLVNPMTSINNEMAEKMAFGAHDVLKKAKIFKTCREAAADSQLIISTSNKKREDKNIITPDLIPEKAVLHNASRISILFGSESDGIPIEDLSIASYHCHIPIHSEYPSLNLSQAVLLIVRSLFENRARIELSNHYHPLNYNEKKALLNFFHSEAPPFKEGLERLLSHSAWDDKDLRFFYYLLKNRT